MSLTHLSHSRGDLPMDLPIHVRSLHDRLLAARGRQRKADFELAMLLAEMAEGRLFLELGYSSLANYAEQVLELPPRTTRELVSLARRVSGLPVTSARLESGELDWTKAREIVRVATPDTEAAWVERAAGVTSRVLEAEVATALFGDMPPTGAPDPERRPERQRVVFEMDSADAEVLRTALSAIRAATHVGDSGASDRATDSVILAGIARAALVALEADKVLTGERYVVVLEHCPDCRRTVSPESEVSDSAPAVSRRRSLRADGRRRMPTTRRDGVGTEQRPVQARVLHAHPDRGLAPSLDDPAADAQSHRLEPWRSNSSATVRLDRGGDLGLRARHDGVGCRSALTDGPFVFPILPGLASSLVEVGDERFLRTDTKAGPADVVDLPHH